MKTWKLLVEKFAVVCCCFICLCSYGQLKENTEKGSRLKLFFKTNIGGQPAVQGKTYTNAFGEQYNLLKFRYYITQILIVDSSNMGSQFFPDDYFLIDAFDSSTMTLDIPLSLKHISYISFQVGVDSEANVSGTQKGSLDPANGMFWTWNTGYIMAKLQGVSPEAKSPAHAFSFDVGGFKTGENAMRKIEFVISKEKKRDKPIHTIVIAADINKLFNGMHAVKIADHPGCHEPGPLAMQLADNYATMFSIENIIR